MADPNQYPPTTAPRRINPTIANAIVTKFKPSAGFEEHEEIKDETGATAIYNGVNKKFKYDIDVVPKAGFTEPTDLSPMQFTAPTASNALPYAGAVNGHINIVVVGEVMSAQDEAGKIAKYSFKGETTANTPNPNN